MQFYRARYDSEGVRAPLKGIHENYPTVEVSQYCINIWLSCTLLHDCSLVYVAERREHQAGSDHCQACARESLYTHLLLTG